MSITSSSHPWLFELTETHSHSNARVDSRQHVKSKNNMEKVCGSFCIENYFKGHINMMEKIDLALLMAEIKYVFIYFLLIVLLIVLVNYNNPDLNINK